MYRASCRQREAQRQLGRQVFVYKAQVTRNTQANPKRFPCSEAHNIGSRVCAARSKVVPRCIIIIVQQQLAAPTLPDYPGQKRGRRKQPLLNDRGYAWQGDVCLLVNEAELSKFLDQKPRVHQPRQGLPQESSLAARNPHASHGAPFKSTLPYCLPIGCNLSISSVFPAEIPGATRGTSIYHTPFTSAKALTSLRLSMMR